MKSVFYLQVHPPAWKILYPDGLIFVDFILGGINKMSREISSFL